jgi:hypothetical protein
MKQQETTVRMAPKRRRDLQQKMFFIETQNFFWSRRWVPPPHELVYKTSALLVEPLRQLFLTVLKYTLSPEKVKFNFNGANSQ